MTRRVRLFSALPWLMIFTAMATVGACFDAQAADPVTNSYLSRGTTLSTSAVPTANTERISADLGLGRWIWNTNFADNQEVRFWRAFTLPATNAVRKANLRITADNVYRLYFDGREIGHGTSWRKLTDYDVTWLLTPGNHVLAVETLNEALEGGMILGLRIQYADGISMQISSDKSWYIVPNDARRRWLTRNRPESDWPRAKEVGVVDQFPWALKQPQIDSPPPLRPIELSFWQTGWFLTGVLGICGVALGLSVRLATKLAVQTHAQQLLERERMLIARDIHDDLGSSLTQLVLRGEVAQTELPEGSPARAHLDDLCERARGAAQTLDEVLWAVNSKRDTLRDFSTYVCKFAQSFLATSSIRCRLDVQSDMPTCEFDLPVRRGMFLAVKEALNNAAKHSGATELYLRISRDKEEVVVQVEDNGCGFDATLPTEGHGLDNMRQRLAEMGGDCRFHSEPGSGCRVEFRMPLAHANSNGQPWWRNWFRSRRSGLEAELGRGNDRRVSET